MRSIQQAIIEFEEMPGAVRYASLYPSLANVDAAALISVVVFVAPWLLVLAPVALLVRARRRRRAPPPA